MRAFFSMILSLVGTCKLRFVKMRPSGPLFDSKSRSISFDRFKTPHARFTSRIGWFYAAKHGASSPGSSGVEPRRFPVWAVLVDLAHLAKVDSRVAVHGPHYAHGRFGPGNPFSAGLNRRCITCPASFRHLHPVNVLDSARRVRGAVLILVAGRARGGARARPVSRGAAFPSGFLKNMLSWKAGSARDCT